MIFYICFPTFCVIFLAIGTYLIVVSLAKDLESDLHCINEDGNENQTRSDTLRQITDFSQLHATVKQLSLPKTCSSNQQ